MYIYIYIYIYIYLSVGLPPCRGGEACVPLGS